MNLKKINACTSLVTAILLCLHVVTTSLHSLTGNPLGGGMGFLPWILAGLMFLHAMLGAVALFGDYDETKKNNGRTYVKMNVPTFIQRISGGVLVLLVVVHIAFAADDLLPQAADIIVTPLFYAVAMTHTAVSLSKAFITLGVGNSAFIRACDVIAKVLCGGLFVLSIAGFCVSLFAEVGV